MPWLAAREALTKKLPWPLHAHPLLRGVHALQLHLPMHTATWHSCSEYGAPTVQSYKLHKKYHCHEKEPHHYYSHSYPCSYLKNILQAAVSCKWLLLRVYQALQSSYTYMYITETETEFLHQTVLILKIGLSNRLVRLNAYNKNGQEPNIYWQF